MSKAHDGDLTFSEMISLAEEVCRIIKERTTKIAEGAIVADRVKSTFEFLLVAETLTNMEKKEK